MDATAERVASLVGLSSAAVATLTRRGIMIRGGPGKLKLEESLRNYCGHLREGAAGRGNGQEPTAQSTERARLVKAQADSAEIKNAVRRGALLDAEAIEAEWISILRTLRVGILRIPRRAGERAHLSAEAVREIDAEVRAVLTELGDS